LGLTQTSHVPPHPVSGQNRGGNTGAEGVVVVGTDVVVLVAAVDGTVTVVAGVVVVIFIEGPRRFRAAAHLSLRVRLNTNAELFTSTINTPGPKGCPANSLWSTTSFSWTTKIKPRLRSIHV
jgi:hypothetical protein